MCSIERITSTTRTVRTPDPTSETGYTEEEVLVWNSTVANLSLMALGTSAPEILLSVIETLGKGMKAGIFAYVWLAFVLLGTSPNEVEIWEAAATLIFFPTLLVVAYLADRNCFRDEQAAPQRKLSSSSAISVTVITKDSTTSSRISMTSQNVTQSANPNQSESVSEGGDEDEEEEEEENFEPTSSLDEASSEAITGVFRTRSLRRCKVWAVIGQLAALALNHNIDEDTAAKLTAMQMNEEKPRSRYWYRINAARIIGGARKLQRKVSSSAAHEAEMAMAAVTDHADGGGRTIVEFSTSGVAVMDGETLARVSIRRRGKQDTTFKVRLVYGACLAFKFVYTRTHNIVVVSSADDYKQAAMCRYRQDVVYGRVETLSGTAVAGETFEPLEEVITFKAGETLKRTHITIHASSMVRANEFFYVKLHLEGESEAQIGENAICSVTIINYKGGAEGEVSVQWCTKDITAIAGQAYEPGDGVLVFEPGELHKSIEIILYPIQQAERDDSFAVLLLDARGGATLGRLTTCVVTIISDDEYNEIVNRIVTKAAAESDPLQSDTSYADQFRQAFNVNGGELDTATFQDYVLHFITFFWKSALSQRLLGYCAI
nr:hypothetical protein BaRGS_031463 [Batillaria attramentaria]